MAGQSLAVTGGCPGSESVNGRAADLPPALRRSAAAECGTRGVSGYSVGWNRSTSVPNFSTSTPNSSTSGPNSSTLVPNRSTSGPNSSALVPNCSTLRPNCSGCKPCKQGRGEENRHRFACWTGVALSSFRKQWAASPAIAFTPTAWFREQKGGRHARSSQHGPGTDSVL